MVSIGEIVGSRKNRLGADGWMRGGVMICEGGGGGRGGDGNFIYDGDGSLELVRIMDMKIE